MSRRTFGLNLLIVVLALIALGFGSWDHYVRRPREKSRARKIARYRRMATHIRRRAEKWGVKDGTPWQRANYRTKITQASWFDGRVQAINKSASFDNDQENRIFGAFLSANEGLSHDMETLDNSY